MTLKITGKDWDECYLNDKGCDKRKLQVVGDLYKILQERELGILRELITVDLVDHSSGFEQFIIKDICVKTETVTCEYYGGGS